MVSGNYFDVLGVGAPAGRTFSAADDDFAAPKAVAVISDGLWRTRFGADPAVAGRTFTLSGQTFTVVGRAPAGFTGMSADAPADLWVPCAAVSLLEPGWNIRDRREIWMSIAARLRSGSDRREAQASLQPVAARIGLEQQGEAGARVRLVPAGASVVDPDARASALRAGALLMGIVGFVLIIACANVASLVLARGAARARELGVRLAIGASRGRVVRQVVTESLVLALAGGAAGLLVAIWTAHLLVALAPPEAVPPGLDIALDVRVMTFATLLSLSTGVLFGAAPAWQLSRADPVAVMRDGAQADRFGRRAAVRMRRAAVVAQIGLSVVLLVMAALFVRTLSAAGAVPSGYDAGHVLLVTIDFSASRAEPAGSLRSASHIIDRVAALPGVESASFGQIAPFSGSLIQRPAVPEGKPSTDDDLVPYTVVGAGYFRTLGLRLRGRDFQPSDTQAASKVVVINETLARRLWPGEEAIGRRLQLPLRTPGPPHEVIGVVSDGRYVSLTEAQRPFLYLPLAQNFRPRLTLHVRTTGSPAAFLTPVRSAVRSVSADLPVYNPITLDESLARSLARERLIARLLTAFGGMALLTAAVGIYGILAFAVARRTREMGVRMALGARSSDLVRLIVRQSAGLVAGGLCAGVAGALLATRLVKAFLFGVPPTDPAAFAGAVILLCAVALVATSVPARRAARIDPLAALRSE